MKPDKIVKITRDHANTVYAIALAEHYRQVERAARKQRKEKKS